MRRTHLLLGSLLILLAPLLAACGQASSEAPSNGKKTVLTTFTILADMARNVAGDAAVVESLTKPGAEIHDYEATPSDLVRAQRADLVLHNGLGLERWFEKFYGELNDVPAATLSEGVEPIAIVEGPYVNKPNPHAWMSPANAIVYVENIRKALVQLDPANQQAYNANALAYSAELRELDARLRASVAALPEARRLLVSCEGAFTYLARDYGLRELYLWPINSDQEGSPQQVAKVIEGVRASGVPAVFCESTVNDTPQRQVASETGASFGGALYVDSLTTADGEAPTYLKLLEKDIDTIIAGLAE